MSERELQVVQSSRQIIEQKLLTALDSDSGQVAILATEADLNMLIRALDSCATHLKITNYPRDADVEPKRCPGCKSPYWNRPRQKKVAKAGK